MPVADGFETPIFGMRVVGQVTTLTLEGEDGPLSLQYNNTSQRTTALPLTQLPRTTALPDPLPAPGVKPTLPCSAQTTLPRCE